MATPRDIDLHARRRKLAQEALFSGMRLSEIARRENVSVVAISRYFSRYFPDVLDRLHSMWECPTAVSREEALSRVWMLANMQERKMSVAEGSRRLGLHDTNLHGWRDRNCDGEDYYELMYDLTVQIRGYDDMEIK